jgi:CPA1 family monovalent cation:H+ antiporter
VPSAELILALLIAVAALVTLARRVGIAYPIFLMIGGLVLGLVPGIPRVEIEPDVIFLIVLPPLLYVAAYFTPVRSLRANLGTISSLAVALVLASALAAAVVARWLVPGLPWSVAIALGAIVAPPDAIAATAIASRLTLPRQIVTILEGESLLNDATALTIYGIAVSAAAGGRFSASNAALTFALVLVGGAVIGVAVGWVIAQIRKRIEDTPVEVTISLLTPYAAYLPAERLDVSGVIAAVAAGLYLGHRAPDISGARMRLTGRAVWDTLIFLLNGFVFIVMGLEVPQLLRTLTPALALRLVGIGLVVCAVLVVVRALFIFATVFLPRMTYGGQEMSWPLGCSLVLSWAGMRGVVSLAAALALPVTLPSGGPLPSREALIVVTLTVIVFTLLGQGLSLPRVIRRLGLGADVGLRVEESSARQRLLEAATQRLDELYPVWPGHRPLLDELRDSYRRRSHYVDRQRDPAVVHAQDVDQEQIEHREIRRTLIDSEREALMRLRAEGEISDEVLRRLERELDLEEGRIDA